MEIEDLDVLETPERFVGCVHLVLPYVFSSFIIMQYICSMCWYTFLPKDCKTWLLVIDNINIFGHFHCIQSLKKSLNDFHIVVLDLELL